MVLIATIPAHVSCGESSVYATDPLVGSSTSKQYLAEKPVDHLPQRARPLHPKLRSEVREEGSGLPAMSKLTVPCAQWRSIGSEQSVEYLPCNTPTLRHSSSTI